MSKIVIVGDTHFSPRTPVSRKDDYPETLLNKLDSLFNVCKDLKATDCIFLGDLINANQMNMEYFIKLYKKFLDFSMNNIRLHTVIGNHDVQHGNKEFLEKSPISLLVDSNLVSNSDFIRDSIRFKLVDYYEPFDIIEEAYPGMCNIFVGHFFYLSGFGDTEHTLSPEQCKKLGYNMYFLGHDHTPYSPLKVNGYQVHRPGSFSRATSDTCQVNRDEIKICVLNTNTMDVEYLSLPGVLPSSCVYKETKLLSDLNDTDIDITLSENIEQLIDSLSFNFSSDIYKVLDELELEEEVKGKVVEYLESEGMFR